MAESVSEDHNIELSVETVGVKWTPLDEEDWSVTCVPLGVTKNVWSCQIHFHARMLLLNVTPTSLPVFLTISERHVGREALSKWVSV